MFQALKTISPGFIPKTIMVEFEEGTMNAIYYEFLETELKGCFLHSLHCIWLQNQDVGL